MFTIGYERSVHRGAPSRGVVKVGRDRSAGVVRSCTPGRTPEEPRQLLRAGPGPGTVERESGKSRWRAGQARFLLGVCYGAPHPLVRGTGKETGRPQARPNLGA